MNALTDRLQLRIDSIFPPEEHDVFMTGTSVVFVEGTTYLVKNLLVSLMLAVLVIATVMSILFRSARMVAISLLPNLVPLIFTAAVMGLFRHRTQAQYPVGVQHCIWHLGGRHHSPAGQIQARA